MCQIKISSKIYLSGYAGHICSETEIEDWVWDASGIVASSTYTDKSTDQEKLVICSHIGSLMNILLVQEAPAKPNYGLDTRDAKEEDVTEQ